MMEIKKWSRALYNLAKTSSVYSYSTSGLQSAFYPQSSVACMQSACLRFQLETFASEQAYCIHQRLHRWTYLLQSIFVPRARGQTSGLREPKSPRDEIRFCEFPPLPDFKPKRTRCESVNYEISKYWSTWSEIARRDSQKPQVCVNQASFHWDTAI